MRKIYKVAIVGGGASGLMCAVELLSGQDAVKTGEVIILERNDRVGKKLIATGNGQGNLCNAVLTEANYYGDKGFVKKVVDGINELNIQDYLYKIGIPLYTASDNKQYPLSRQASAVLDILRAYIGDRACIQTGFYVQDVVDNGEYFSLKSQSGEVLSENVVLAFGGMAGKQFGTDGSSYKLAEKFGHKKTGLYPSLVQLKTELEPIRGLKGLKEQARITAFDGIVPLKSQTGEVLFTEYGISGSAVFQISGHMATAKNPSIDIEFLPHLSISETEELIKYRTKNTPQIKQEDILCGILNKRIGQAVLKTAKSRKVEDVAYAIKNFSLKVTGSLDFNYAQVTKGGIKTDSVNPTTFRSKLVKRLYLTGELLDVDGDCGGYNLTFAFYSGINCAKSIKNNKFGLAKTKN